MTNQKELMLKMAKLQADLNTATNGSEWIKGITNKGKEINWIMCICVEAVEMLDSLPWKHWKDINAKPDIANFKLEYVDVWHFVLSSMIESAVDAIIKNNLQLPVEEQIDYTNEMLISLGIEQVGTIPTYDEFVEPRRTELEGVTEKFRKSPDNLDNILQTLSHMLIMNPISLDTIYHILYILETDYEFSFVKLHNLYIGKNALNMVRTENGYKEGTYVKNWNICGTDDVIEDNEVMMSYVEDIGDGIAVSLEEAKTWLTDFYTKDVLI